jgi:hypothetical protein
MRRRITYAYHRTQSEPGFTKGASCPSRWADGSCSRRKKSRGLLKGEKMRDFDSNTNLDLITVDELADALRVPTSWVYSRTRTADQTGFAVLKCGKYCRFEFNAVLEWLREQQVDEEKT